MDYYCRNKSNTIDPLSVVIKLYIMSHMAVGTKISVLNNRINIQENNLIQGLLRRFNDDKNVDLAIISSPISYVCDTYLTRCDVRKRFRPLFVQAVEGLKNIKQTYINNKN